LRSKVSTQPVQELFGAERCEFVHVDLVDVDDATADGAVKHVGQGDAVELMT
jgi:hypothetical protein